MSTRLAFWDVDTQFDFMDPEGDLYVPDAKALDPNLERLTGFARELEIPVVASADDHQLSDAEIDPDEPDGETTFPPHCMRGTPGAERIEETRLGYTLVLEHDERRSPEDIRRDLDHPWPRVLIKKNQLDVFGNPNADTVLAALDPERIVVYGVALDFCVAKTVEGLLERGYDDLVLVTDATEPIDAERGEELLESWKERGVELTTTETLAVRLDRMSRSASV